MSGFHLFLISFVSVDPFSRQLSLFTSHHGRTKFSLFTIYVQAHTHTVFTNDHLWEVKSEGEKDKNFTLLCVSRWKKEW